MTTKIKDEKTVFQFWAIFSGALSFVADIVGIVQAFGWQRNMVGTDSYLFRITDTYVNFGTIEVSFRNLTLAGLIYTLFFLPIGARAIHPLLGRLAVGVINPLLLALWGIAFYRGNWIIVGLILTTSCIWLLTGVFDLNRYKNTFRARILGPGCTSVIVLIPAVALILIGFGEWNDVTAWIYSIIMLVIASILAEVLSGAG